LTSPNLGSHTETEDLLRRRIGRVDVVVRFGISRGTVLAQSRREHADLLPSGPALRDEAFTRTQSTLPGLGAEQAG